MFSMVFSMVFRIRINLIRIRIQHFRLNTDPDPGFWRTKIYKIYSWEKFFFGSKIAIYLSLGSRKGRPSLEPSKRTSSTSKHEISEFFFYFYGSFLPSWIRIRIRIHGPDLIRIQSGSGNTGFHTAHPPAWWRASRWGSDSWRWRWRPADRCMTPWRRGWSGHVTGSTGSPGSPQLPAGHSLDQIHESLMLWLKGAKAWD